MNTRTRAAVVITLTTAIALVVEPVASGKRPPAPPPDFSGLRNVILFIGDGMGPEHLELARRMTGGSLGIDSVPWTTGSVDTTSLDGVTDSAAAATAIATGVETYNGWLSMAPGNPAPETVLERAESKGKATGLITDLNDADATPAAFAAHVPDRDLDEDITGQMAAKDIELLISGGWGYSSMLEGREGVTYVGNLEELSPYLSGTIPYGDHMYGFFGPNEMAYTLDREEEGVVGVEPTLPQLTEAAIGVLGQDPEGFFVMIEAGSNDWGGHSRDAAWVNAEIQELDDAIGVAVAYAQGRNDTLVVVTGDHETGGLDVGPKVNPEAIGKVKATTEWMWGLIAAGKMSIKQTLATYAGITDLSRREEQLVAANKEMGIADVLSARQNVAWGWNGTDEGDHTATPVPLLAWGPGQGAFSGHFSENEHLGARLLSAVSG